MIITLLPESPCVYVISTAIAGSSLLNSNSSNETTLTAGVVMSTRLSSIVATAVAEAPKLIFIISPIASISIELRYSWPILSSCFYFS